ncbi:QacE family quaternary ammonium compound efflux SMR transporter [Marinobacterium zhoushanense]|uniref:QacE family quaternary ammonium compound efflux SMR transporter n=1 Tax=Marinobacterium zhoushanense TaxID=1679163 RepID=A0ABQ1KY29_9GAMM|nr:multidrug efflux SMR transporter [Marinobacterium zhoushanense]GGC10619.1 QacE family quaternary ammonium compound efflux SMR transporter [Marinobacterium zhoushanense]
MTPLISTYAILALAILLEVVGTTYLQKSEQFTQLVPTLIMAGCYIGAFYFLSLVLKQIPLGLAYAIWSGLGIVLIAAAGYVLFRQTLDLAAMIGIGFIIVGVMIVNLFSTSITH